MRSDFLEGELLSLLTVRVVSLISSFDIVYVRGDLPILVLEVFPHLNRNLSKARRIQQSFICSLGELEGKRILESDVLFIVRKTARH